METEEMSDSEIGSVFVDNEEYISISKLATETVPKTLHFDFETTEEFEAWDERNEVVHEGYIPSEDKTKVAYDAANNARGYLMNKIEKRHNELKD